MKMCTSVDPVGLLPVPENTGGIGRIRLEAVRLDLSNEDQFWWQNLVSFQRCPSE
jgi:hypothetical protein